MNHTEEELSLEFYHHFCNIVGSDDVVKTRRVLFAIMDYVHSCNGIISLISSGSKAEGLDLKGSDFDMMLVNDFIQVYEDINNVINNRSHVSFLMETNDTKAGFTKLKVYPIFNRIPFFDSMFDTLGGEQFISSKRFRDYLLSPGMIIHGPCVSIGEDYDRACSLRCKEWITSAQPWINRPRSTLPDYKLVTSIIQYGVVFVPIGSKFSPNENLEWRISLSMAEKQLIYSFSHTQLLCYALLKIILKDIIKPKHGDLICSYFLKTIMFWLSEETCPSDWKPKSFFSCFLNCLRRIIYCVEYKTCLHYFIPENNLFEDRFTDDQQVSLLNTLQFIYISPWTAILNTSTFQQHKLDSRNSYEFELTVSALPCLGLSFFNSYVYPVYGLVSFNRAITCCINFPDQESCKYVMSLVSNHYIQAHHSSYLTICNKSFYRQNHIIFGTVKIGLSADVLNSWLLFASYLYQCKSFKQCIYIISYCLSKCTPDNIPFYSFGSRLSLEEHTVFKENASAVGSDSYV